MARLESIFGSQAEMREPVGIPDNLFCNICNVGVNKILCKESVKPIDKETLDNLHRSGIENFTKEFNLSCPKCSSQIYGILIEG